MSPARTSMNGHLAALALAEYAENDRSISLGSTRHAAAAVMCDNVRRVRKNEVDAIDERVITLEDDHLAETSWIVPVEGYDFDIRLACGSGGSESDGNPG